jgi:hypothetical protein
MVPSGGHGDVAYTRLLDLSAPPLTDILPLGFGFLDEILLPTRHL